jgi:hypothetical protein
MLKQQLADKDQTITHLTKELQNRDQVIENLAQSYAAHDMTAIFDGLRKSLSEQIDKTREFGGRQYWDLMGKLEQGHNQIQKLQGFIAVTMRHVGRMEGQAKLSNQITLSPEESRDVIHAAEIYQRTLQP